MKLLYSFSALLLISFFDYSHESQIIFTASPSGITSTTTSLTLRCSVNDDVILGRRGRRDLALDLGAPNIYPEVRRQMRADVEHVTSIVISRSQSGGANDTVASITAFTPAQGFVDPNLQVTGNIDSPTPGENAYLELTWTNPTPAQYGTYNCEVNGLNAQSHPENFQDSLSVGLFQPTIAELMLYINDLENRTATLEQQLANIQTGSTLQTGIVACHQGTNDYDVTFDDPYTRTPSVVTAIAGTNSGDAYAFTPTVLNESPTGFTLRCTSQQTTSVVWIAL